jgi:hypothetical protein
MITTITSKNLREVAFNVTKGSFEVRNHISHPDKDVQTVRLLFKLTPAEFTSYEVVKECCLIVSSQDLHSIIEFAEEAKEEVKILFTENGKPLITSVLSADGTTRVQMFVSSMKERDLKEARKVPSTTSYKEVVTSYLETRKGQVGSEAIEMSFRNLSETEMQRTVSPRVDTFGSHGMTSISALRAEPSNPQKRKSSELLPQIAQDFDVEANESFDHHKKQRLEEVQSQAEEQEVSQIIADLENMAYEDENAVSGNPPRNTSSLTFLDGMEKFKVNLPRQLSDETDSDRTHCSARFDKSKARFATEDLQGDLNQDCSSSSSRSLRSSLKPANENRKIPKNPLQIKKVITLNSHAKNTFLGVLKSANSKIDGNVQVQTSDPESD